MSYANPLMGVGLETVVDRLAEGLRAAERNTSATALLKDVLRPYVDLSSALPIGNRPVHMRMDPLFRLGLTTYPDEREFYAMERSEMAVSTPIKAVVRTLLGEGWIVKAPDTPATDKAALYAEFGMALFSRCKGFQYTLRHMAKTRYYGWTLFQLLWDVFDFKGQPKRGIRMLVDQRRTEFFSFTVDTDALVFLGDGVRPPYIFEAPGERDCWFPVRWGTNYGPFGTADMSYWWFTAAVLRRFRSLYETGARNALQGVPVLSYAAEGGAGLVQPGAPIGDRATLTFKLKDELRTLMKIHEELGALALTPGFKLEEFKNIEGAAGWQAAIAALITELQIGIQGDQLSTAVADSGSRALGEVHAGSKLDNAIETGRGIAEELDQLLRRAIEINFPNPDPGDMPRFVFGIESRFDVGQLQQFIAMGGEADAGAVARIWHIPVAPGSNQTGTLKRQEPASALLAALAGGRGAPGAPTEPDPTEEPTDPSTPPKKLPKEQRRAIRSLAAVSDGADAAVAGLEAAEVDRVAGVFEDYVGLLRAAIVDGIPEDDLAPKA